MALPPSYPQIVVPRPGLKPVPVRVFGTAGPLHVSELKEDFQGPLDAVNRWAVSKTGTGTANTVTGGQLVQTQTTTNNTARDTTVASNDFLSLRESATFIQLATGTFGTSASGGEMGFVLIGGATLADQLLWVLASDGSLNGFARINNVDAPNSVTLTYSATDHAWWRIRHTEVTIYWDTAPITASDPPAESDWVNQGTFPLASFPAGIDAFNTKIYTFSFHSVGAITAKWDGLNIASAPNTGSQANLSNVAGTGTVNTTTVFVDTTLATVFGTGQVGNTALFVDAALTNVVGTGTVNTTTVFVDTALTNVVGTGVVNTTTVFVNAALTNVVGTGQVNTTSVASQSPLANVVGTGFVNTTSVAIGVALTGVASTTFAGNVAPVIPITTVNATGLLNTFTVFVDKTQTGVASAGAPGSVSATDTAGQTGNSGTGQVGAVSSVGVADPLTTVASPGQAGSLSPSNAVSLTNTVGTGLPGTLSATDTSPLATAAATGLPGTLSASEAVPLTTVAATGLPGNVALGAPDAFLSGAPATGTPGAINSVAADVVATGIQAAMAVGNLLANPPVDAATKNHTDLFIRQFLEDYYTREWQKKEPTTVVAAVPNKPKVLPPKAKMVRRAIEQDQSLLLEPSVMRLVSNTQALKVSLASLQRSFTVQSQPSESDEDEDLLLLSSVL